MVYDIKFDDVITSKLAENLKILFCNSESNGDIKDALSGIMANDLKFPSIHERIRQYLSSYTFHFKVSNKFEP